MKIILPHLRGVTLIELLLVVALIAVIGATMSPFPSNFFIQSNIVTTTDHLVSALRKAQNYSLDGKNNVVWGVCLTGQTLRLFAGSCTAPTFTEDFTVPASVTISSLPEVTFSLGRGEPSQAFTTSLTTDISSHTHTVRLNAAGGMEIN